MTLPPEALRIPDHLLRGSTVLAGRDAILPLLPKRAAFAEIGVGTGGFTRQVLQVCAPEQFVAIDEFRLHELPELWGQPRDAVFGDGTHLELYRAAFAEAIAAGRMRVLEGDSADRLERLDDASLDVIYIDADHRYEAVRRDLAAARRKIRAEGWIIVNDYLMVAELGATHSYGVVHATNEFMLEHDWGMQYLALQTRMFCDVVLRPRHAMCDDAAETSALREEVALLRRSTSWRITRPLRAAGRLLKRRISPG
nr:class I SAM-dependent methyltransferase [uncultured Lichenicoccus sp.]